MVRPRGCGQISSYERTPAFLNRFAELPGGKKRQHGYGGWEMGGAPHEELGVGGEVLVESRGVGGRLLDLLVVEGEEVADGRRGAAHGVLGEVGRPQRLLQGVHAPGPRGEAGEREGTGGSGRQPRNPSQTWWVIGGLTGDDRGPPPPPIPPPPLLSNGPPRGRPRCMKGAVSRATRIWP